MAIVFDRLSSFLVFETWFADVNVERCRSRRYFRFSERLSDNVNNSCQERQQWASVQVIVSRLTSIQSITWFRVNRGPVACSSVRCFFTFYMSRRFERWFEKMKSYFWFQIISTHRHWTQIVSQCFVVIMALRFSSSDARWLQEKWSMQWLSPIAVDVLTSINGCCSSSRETLSVRVGLKADAKDWSTSFLMSYTWQISVSVLFNSLIWRKNLLW